jgi:hypothetical protein
METRPASGGLISWISRDGALGGLRWVPDRCTRGRSVALAIDR